MKYDVIVVGGGHAGCEACLASARMNHKTLLITGNLSNVGDMPCNPSIGGSAKGIIVREIDALGGEMGRNCDKSILQMKMLNNKKGPAVKALRAQADKTTYPKEMLNTINNTVNLETLEEIVEDLIIKDGKVEGVILSNGKEILGKTVILTTGTYLKADILIGDERLREGPHGEKPSNYLSENLAKYGLRIKRLKTGTPARLDKHSIDYSKMSPELGDREEYTFSFDNKVMYDVENQEPCHLIYTNSETHKIIKENLNKSSIYGGRDDVEGIGPRYCPSIEDKIVKFADKERHQLFLEPESQYYDDMYLQGFSTSMPRDVQEKMLRSLSGLENVKILKYAYAIEYDAIYPDQLNYSLETKIIENLFTAGQINGTSGYEEAAGQGIIAGINACLKLEGKDPLILKRNEAYIGVLIDDLITKGIRDPYRMLTSRAEYRLLLRHDNADIRLRRYGHKYGLVNDTQMNNLESKLKNISNLIDFLKNNKLTPTEEVNKYLEDINSTVLKDGISLYNLLKRPEITMDNIKYFFDIEYSAEVIEQVVINIKYEGYINKANREAEKMIKNESKKIPSDIDYDKVYNLASEGRQKLKEVRPENIGQAMRISGVNPADISVLLVYLKKEYSNV